MKHYKKKKKSRSLASYLKNIKNPYLMIIFMLVIMVLSLTVQNIHLYNIVSDLSAPDFDVDTQDKLMVIDDEGINDNLNSNQNNNQAFSELINKANAHNLIDDYSLYEVVVEPIAQEKLEIYAKEKPVIYGNLSGSNLYNLEYVSDTGGYLMIYDSKTDEVLKLFRTSKVSLS